jgi:hypothetical protein
VRELRVDLARVHHAALAHELQHRVRLPSAPWATRCARARVHQVVRGARQEAVVDEEVLFDRQPR